VLGRRIGIGLALLGVAAILAAAWLISQSSRPAGDDREVRQALLEELQPVALENCTLGRFGGPDDTGFLMCKNLIEEVEAVYSYGLVANDDWACEVSRRYGIPVQQYNCVAPSGPACVNGDLVMHEVCLGDRAAEVEARSFDTLASHVAANGHRGRRLLVKIDVEGAEWDALMATPDEVLERIDQLPIEFHGVNEQRFLEVLRKLKRTFHIVNLYFNNHACSPESSPLPAWAYQVLLVNKRIGRLDPTEPGPVPPSPLNARDDPTRPDCQPEVPGREAREARIRQALFDTLRPLALRNCTLKRFGSANDGGYLLCENLIADLGAAYSYGVGPNDDWGCEISTRYRVPVHQYDCFDPSRPVCKTGTFRFNAECIGDRRELINLRQFDSLPGHISANGDAGKRLLVKIDVEGAEWDALMATPDEVLERIDQLPMELHGVDERRFVKVVEKLKRTFYLVNVHYNNHSCADDLAPFPAWAYQVLFVNKRLGELDPAVAAPPPSPLNAPDNPNRPECQALTSQ
jgi:hypothetical protein